MLRLFLCLPSLNSIKQYNTDRGLFRALCAIKYWSNNIRVVVGAPPLYPRMVSKLWTWDGWSVNRSNLAGWKTDADVEVDFRLYVRRITKLLSHHDMVLAGRLGRTIKLTPMEIYVVSLCSSRGVISTSLVIQNVSVELSTFLHISQKALSTNIPSVIIAYNHRIHE